MKKYRSKKAGENIIRTYDQILNEWGVLVEEMDLTTRYGVTHVITAGKDTSSPLILFHGVGDDSALMWIYNAKAFAKKYKIYAIDTIGGPGKSEMSAEYNKTYDDVAWIEEVMKKLNLTKASFIGVSHGGYLVQLFSLRRSKMVEKAISISAAVPCQSEKGPMRTMIKIFFPEALFPTNRNIRKLLQKLSGDNVRVFTENKLILEHYSWLLKGFNNMTMKYHKVEQFSDEEIECIRDKVCYLVGEEDPFQKLGGKKQLVEQHMNAHFYTGAGHGLNHENSKEVNQMIIDILEGTVQNIRNYVK